MSSHLSSIARISLFALLAASSALTHAADGIIRIRGAVVEPACSVSTTALSFEKETVRKVSPSRTNAAMPLELNMYCHARQAIKLRMIQLKSKIRAGFETGIDGVRMQLRHNGQVVVPGEAMSIALPQRTGSQIRMDTQLEAVEKNAGVPDVMQGASQAGKGGRMLVAIDYQ